MKAAFESAIPILRIVDVDKALAFWVGFLGFSVEWTHRTGDAGPTYLSIIRGDCRIHLSEHHGDGCPGAVVFVPVADIAALHAELIAKDYPFMRPTLDDSGHDSRSVQVIDPFGNRVRFDG
jgi:catechol 2,3-dioxygenase-like lactoylglutathione lyase family enzyme